MAGSASSTGDSPNPTGLVRLNLPTPRNWDRRLRLACLAAICLAGIVALLLAPRVPLGPGYHDFADKRTMWGLPNALDVLSNLPFCIAGVWGLVWLLGRSGRSAFVDPRERVPWLIFFAGVTLTGAGSWWYHMAPSDRRLPWDLLPMTCSFMSIVVVTYMERVNLRAGYVALVPMLVLGASSVVYWRVTAALGHGDYKFYLFVQFFSPVVLVLLIALFPPRYTGMRWLALAFGLYVAAKIFETWDYSFYRHLRHTVSGHSLKHATAGVACWCILEMLRRRRVVAASRVAAEPHAAYHRNGLTLSR